MLDGNSEEKEDEAGTSLREDLQEALNPTNEDEKDTDNVEEQSEEDEAGEDSEDEESPESSETDDDKSGDSSETEGEEDESLAVPDQWSDDDKELFNGQSDDVKQYLLNRHKSMEADYTKKTQTLAEQRKENEALNQFAEKWTPHVAPLGVPLVNALDQLLQNDAQLRNGTPEQKIAVATQLLRAYGVDISALVPAPATATTEPDEYADPVVKALQDQITQINGTLTERDQQDQQALANQQATIVTQVQSAFETFKTATDESGNPKYPHLEAVRSQMGVLVANNQAGTGDINSQLESAYESALWMNSETREQLLKDQQSSTKKEGLEKQKKAAAQAKKSAKANKTGTKANTEQPKNLSLREDLALQIEQANA